MDWIMSNRQILLVALTLGFVSGFAWVAAMQGTSTDQAAYASVD
jgi:hypothetical protein